MQVILHESGKAVTVIADNGNRVEHRALSHLFYCHRTDGGVTLWADGQRKVETVRVNRHGLVMKNKAVKKSRR